MERAKERIDKAFAIYPTLPSYRAMLDREGADGPSDVAVVGTEDEVVSRLDRLAEVGATDFVASVLGSAEERQRTVALLGVTRPGLAGDGRVLELVDLGAAHDQLQHALDGRPGQRAVALRAGHQPHEDGAVLDDEGRHAEYLMVRD